MLKINGLFKRIETLSPGFCKGNNSQHRIFLDCFGEFIYKLFVLRVGNRFRPRILIDVSKIDVSTTVLGFNISMPIMIAPTAMQRMAHPDGK